MCPRWCLWKLTSVKHSQKTLYIKSPYLAVSLPMINLSPVGPTFWRVPSIGSFQTCATCWQSLSLSVGGDINHTCVAVVPFPTRRNWWENYTFVYSGLSDSGSPLNSDIQHMPIILSQQGWAHLREIYSYMFTCGHKSCMYCMFMC